MQDPTLQRNGSADHRPPQQRHLWLVATAVFGILALLIALVTVLQQAVETGQARQALFTSQSAQSGVESN